MVVDASSAFVPELISMWMSALNMMYTAMHSVVIFGLPLDNVVAIVIFLNALIAIYLWRLNG